MKKNISGGCDKCKKIVKMSLPKLYNNYMNGKVSILKNIINKKHQHGGDVFNTQNASIQSGATQYDYDSSLTVPYNDVNKFTDLAYKNGYVYKPVNKVDNVVLSNFASN